MSNTKFNKGNKRGKGRPKGSPNKLPAEIRNKMAGLLVVSIDIVRERLDKMTIPEMIAVMALCAKYTMAPPRESVEPENMVIKITGDLLK